MDPAQKIYNDKFLSLKITAKIFDVNVEDLMEWNDNNILKPIITQSGEVGYTKEQIDKFLSLQNLIRSKNNTLTPSTSTLNGSLTSKIYDDYGTHTNFLQDNTRIHQSRFSDSFSQGSEVPSTPNSKSNRSYDKIFSVALVSAIAIAIASFSFTSNIHKTDPSFPNNPLKIDTISKQLSTITLSHIINGGFVESNFINHTFINDKQNSPAINTSTNDTSELASALYYDDQRYGSEKLQIVPILAINTETEDEIDNSILNNFASRPNAVSKTSDYSLYENVPNISDEVDVLSMKLGTSTMHYNDHLTANVLSLNILIAALFLSFLWTVYAYKNRYSIALLNPNSSTPHHSVPPNFIHTTDTLEVVQKLDGTVSIVFGDNEYKVSKPELNSETDRLIQRLMKLTNSGDSEIRYDVLEDDDMELNAPLSKIVTRLGFVGTKRDLFFPRTSKNKVVFRRRLTPQNLRSLELTEEQLLLELSN